MSHRPIALSLLLVFAIGCSDSIERDDGALMLRDAGGDEGEGASDLDTRLDRDDMGDPGALDHGTFDLSEMSPDDADEDTGERRDGGEDASTSEEMGPASLCGDGRIEGDEVCDDTNTDGGDYCAPDCLAVTGECGDGVVQSNESCDDGAITQGCDISHNGGDGTCVMKGMCVEGYQVDGAGVCQPEEIALHVHIEVSNQCVMTITPTSIEVPVGQRAILEFHNHSRDYPVDVWGSYIGGYLDLAPGATWNDRYWYCGNINRPYSEYVDISTACSMVRLPIDCAGP